MFEALFANIIEITIAVSAVAVLLLAISPLLGKVYPARWRCWAWLILAVRLLVPFNFSLPQAPVVLQAPEQAVIYRQTAPQQAAPPAQTGGEKLAQPKAEQKAPATRAVTLAQRLAAVWLAGVGAFLLWQVSAQALFWRMARRWSTPVQSPAVSALFERLAGESGSSRRPKLAVCKRVSGPMLAGLLHPVVLLPCEDYSEDDLYAILKHELAHEKRHDLWYKLVLLCANALHWFNPLMWLMVRAANRDLELACDDDAVRGESLAFRKCYSRAILAAVHRSQSGTALATSFYGGKHVLRQRLAGILDTRAKRKGVAALCVLLVAALAVGGLVACSEKAPASSYGAASNAETDPNLPIAGTVAPAKLTEEQREMLKLASFSGSTKVFDYSVNSAGKSIELYSEVYQNGEFLGAGGGFIQPCGAPKGKILLNVGSDARAKTTTSLAFEMNVDTDGKGGSGYSFTVDLPQSFQSRSYQELAGEAVVTDEQDALLYLIAFDPHDLSTQNSLEEIAEDKSLLANYSYAVLIKCHFSKETLLGPTEIEYGAGENKKQEYVPRTATNTLRPVELSPKEKEILKLTNLMARPVIYEYTTDDTIKSAELWLESYQKGVLVESAGRVYGNIANMQGKFAFSLELPVGRAVRWNFTQQSGDESMGSATQTETPAVIPEEYADRGVSVQAGEQTIVPEKDYVLEFTMWNKEKTAPAYTAEEITKNPKLLEEFEYVCLVKCRFSTQTSEQIDAAEAASQRAST